MLRRCAFGRWRSPAKHHQVLAAGQLFVHRGVLAGKRDESADLVRLLQHVVAGDRRSPAIRPQQRGEDANRGGLARTVGTQECKDLTTDQG